MIFISLLCHKLECHKLEFQCISINSTVKFQNTFFTFTSADARLHEIYTLECEYIIILPLDVRIW